MIKGIENIRAMLNENRDSYFGYLRDLQTSVKCLEGIYRENVSGTPKETVEAFIADSGYDTAEEVVATLINRHGWDGRIGRANKDWAADKGWDEEAAEKMDIYTNRIHMAHLDQIATAFRRYSAA